MCENGKWKDQMHSGWRERVGEELTRIGGYLGGGVKAQGNSVESTRVILVMILNNGGYRAIFCNQARIPVVGLAHQLSHKTLTYSLFCLQAILGQ